jgi:hypothetical protein|tara:strand:- start:292 stop:468 length:177 start_codon:yes stop_codon:yes gene_type:complete
MSEVYHTPQQCSTKLVALLDKLNKIDTRDTHSLQREVDDAKVLAAELSREKRFLELDK